MMKIRYHLIAAAAVAAALVGALAHRLVLRRDTLVLNGHFPASEGDQLGAEAHVLGVKGGARKGFVCQDGPE